MISYNSVRIYVKSLMVSSNGFYDVIGYYGNATRTNNSVVINMDEGGYPIVKLESGYYYLYDDFLPNPISDISKAHLLVEENIKPIYLDSDSSDFNIIAYDYPINENIDIYNIENLVCAYRKYIMDVYDDRAIRRFDGTINDPYNIIDSTDKDLIFVETNPDNYIFSPTGGIVLELYTFQVTCNKQIAEVRLYQPNSNPNSLVTISLYEKETKLIKETINYGTKEVSGNSFSFVLNNKYKNPGVYFLYLPSGIIKFADNSVSPMVLIKYTINASGSDTDIQAFSCLTSGKKLSSLDITYYNIGTYSITVERMSNASITVVRQSDGLLAASVRINNSSSVYESSSLIVTIDFGTTIVNNGTTPEIYNIIIPRQSFYLSDEDYNNLATIEFTVYPLNYDLPVNGNYIIKFTPQLGSQLIKLSQFKISFCLDKYLDHKSSNVYDQRLQFTVKNALNEVWQTNFVSLGSSIEYDLGYKLFTFTYNLSNPITTPGYYTITIPKDSFSLDNDGFNDAFSCSYLILEFIELDENSSETYLYDMLKIVPKDDYLNEIISFKRDNTIFVNSAKLSNVLFSPVISLIDYKNNQQLTGKLFNPNENPNAVLEMYCSLRALDSKGKWINDSASYNSLNPGESTSGFLYGLDMYGSRQFYKLYKLELLEDLTPGLFFKDEDIFELPRSMFLKLEVKLDGNYVAIETNILFLEDSVYEKYHEDQNWVIEDEVDIYSGEQCTHVYVTPNKTNIYDSVVVERIYDSVNDMYKDRYVVELENVTKVRLGNLDGIYNETFKDKQPHGFGLYGLNVFLTGNFYLNNGRSMLDIDNDITLATGNINSIRKNLENLDNQLQQTSELFDQKVTSAERAVPSTISNFISTNRDAIFKLGLDYSIWSLGSAGISLYNPNVKYTYDEYGNKVVDDSTVGDFDEGVLIQADKLRINNYYSVTIDDVTYYKVIVTSANPKDWVYPDLDSSGLFFPKMREIGNNSNRDVPFKYFYIKQSDIQKATLCSTLGSEDGSILRYVYIMEDDLGDPYCPINKLSLGENYTVYAFNSFYTVSPRSITFYDIKNDSVSDAKINDLVWFLPYTIQAALFNNGKIYAKYISTEGLEVEHVIAIPKDLTPWDPYGYKNIRKNDSFDITKPVSDDNYPVVYDQGTYQFSEDGDPIVNIVPEKTVPFVIISGYTGKVTAKSADIQGTVTIGDKDGQNSKYIVISDNVDLDNAVERGKTPAMYIMSNQNGYPVLIAKFSGDDEGDLTKKYFDYDNEDVISYSDVVTNLTTNSTHIVNLNSLVLPNRYLLEMYNRVDSAGYPVTSVSNNIVSILNINSSEKNRILKFNIGLSLSSFFGIATTLGETNTLYSYIDSGKLVGSLTIRMDFYVKEHNDSTYTTEVSIGTIYKKLNFDYRGVNTTYLKSSFYKLLVLDANSSGYDVYCKFYDNAQYYIYNSSIGTVNYPLTIEYNCSSINVNINSSTLLFFSQYTGNGMSSGFDKNNYFASYYQNNNDGYQKMITQFRSGGIGMLFDTNNQFYLLPDEYVMPMSIPVLYFECHPEWAGATTLFLPSKDKSKCKVVLLWERSVLNTSLQQYNSDLVNFFALKMNYDHRGDTLTYEYPATYGDTEGTIRPRGRDLKKIKINGDVIYEFNFKKLIDLIHEQTGVWVNDNNIKVNLTRIYGNYYKDGNYSTELGHSDYVAKLNEVKEGTVYISTLNPESGNYEYGFYGSVEMLIPYYQSNELPQSTTYTSEQMAEIKSYWTSVKSQLDSRYLNLTNELKLQISTLMLSFSDDISALDSTNVISTVNSITSDLNSLKTLIENKLTEFEGGSDTLCDSCSVSQGRFLSTAMSYANGGQGVGIADAAGYSSSRVIGELKGCQSIPNVEFTITAGGENVGDINTFISAWNNVTITLETPDRILPELQAGLSERDAHGENNYLIVASYIPANTSGGYIHAHFTPNCESGHISFKLNYNSSATVTPPTTPPSSDNTGGLYSVTGSGYHNNASDAVSADGTITISVGKIYDIDSSLSGNTPAVWAVYDIEGSNVITKSSVSFARDGSDWLILAIVNPNSTSSTRRSKVFVTFDGGNHYAYVNVYQNANSGGESSTTNSFDAIEVDSSTISTITPFLTTVKNSSGIDLNPSDSTSDIFKFIARAYKKASSLCLSDSNFKDVVDGPVKDLESVNNPFTVDTNFLLGMILTMLYPFTGTYDITGDSNANSRLNYIPLQKALKNRIDLNASEADHNLVYGNLLNATIGFSRMLSDPDFRESLNNIKDSGYSSNFLARFNYNDGTDFLSSDAAPGATIFPGHPGVNVNDSNKTALLTRDINCYNYGKSLRNYTTTEGKRAYDDRNDSLKYYIEVCSSASGKSVGSYTNRYGLSGYNPADNPNNSYYVGNQDNGRHTYISDNTAYTPSAWSTFVSTNKPGLLDNKKFAHLYFSIKTGVRTVNAVKNANSRTRPFLVYGEVSSSSEYDSDFSDGIQKVDSDTAGLYNKTSYPSGHSGYFWGFALSWASMFLLTDSQATALFKRAYQYCEGRVIVGAHWQYCIEMGRLAAGCSFSLMCANQLFINSIDTALA